MAQVRLTIAGRAFVLACDDGEEARLEALADVVNDKITEIRSAFGEIGDQRLMLMAALTLADSLAESQQQCLHQEQLTQEANQAIESLQQEMDHTLTTLAHTLNAVSERLDSLSEDLTG